MAQTMDKDIQTYRDLIETPETFEDGFSLKTLIGAILLGMLITPGSLYISLVAGEAVGPAARWVTIFLFAEVAKRSLKELRQQEVFVLYYMTSVVLLMSSGGIPQGPLWNIYMTQSDAFKAMNITEMVPDWIVPRDALPINGGTRSLFSVAWIPAILFVCFSLIITRIDYFGLGYLLYRITNDVERLPFPMAPIGASGILAMAETKDKDKQWRPACFAIGGIIGLMFGFVYIGLPALTSVLFREPVYLLPIPWIELTPVFQDILPATPINIVPNLALMLMGMVLPFWAVIGGAIGFLMTIVLNQFLYQWGILDSWRPGMQTVDTLFNNQIDFYFSFTFGISLFIAGIGIVQALIPILRARKTATTESNVGAGGLSTEQYSNWQILMKGSPKRGDISIWVALAIYVSSTAAYILFATWLVDGFPWPIFLIYGFIYTPIMGYAAARVEGLAGQTVAIPFVKEAAFILSGYKGAAIWFAPIPVHNYGYVAKEFRQVELTGTKLSSVIKTELVSVPILLISIILFSSIIWSQASLNSSQYPHVQKVWDLQARNMALIFSSTLPGERSQFFEALNGNYILCGAGLSVVIWTVLSGFGLPIFLLFGIVRGLGQTNPAAVLPELVGALLGRFYFQKRFGDMWLKFTPGIFAGFTCGVGLIGMISVALRLIAKSISPMDF